MIKLIALGLGALALVCGLVKKFLDPEIDWTDFVAERGWPRVSA